MEYGNQNILPIPPLCLILLNKCKDNRKNIPKTILEMRKEFKDLREHFHKLESHVLGKHLFKAAKAKKRIKKLSETVSSKYVDIIGPDELSTYSALNLLTFSIKSIIKIATLLSLDGKDLIDYWESRTLNQFFSITKKAALIENANTLIEKIFGRGFPETEIALLKKLVAVYHNPSIKFKNLIC